MLAFVLYSLHVLVCLFLIMVVLLQQGKGADLSVFGGGGTMTAFGARGAATVLHKLTVISFVLFIVTTLTIGVLQSGGSRSSVLSAVETIEGEEDAALDETAPASVDEAAATLDSDAASEQDLESVESGSVLEDLEEPPATDVPPPGDGGGA